MNRTSMLAGMTSVLFALLAIAVATRVTWELLRPVVPLLLVVCGLLGVIRLAAERRRYW